MKLTYRISICYNTPDAVHHVRRAGMFLYGKREPMDNYFDVTLTEDELRAISAVGLAHLGDAV